MPNWTYNSCEITGNVDDVKSFMDTITDYHEQEIIYNFTNCMPMPEEYENMHEGAMTIDEVREEVWYSDKDGVRPVLDMVKDRLKKEYGTYKPIEWQYRHWGTKWGDSSTELISDVITKGKRELHFRFESAWSEPFFLLNHIANMFNLTIVNTWDIELGNGDGTTNYPWDDDYLNESIEASNQMFESLNDMKFE